MISLANATVDPTPWRDIVKDVLARVNVNPACKLAPVWESEGEMMLKGIVSGKWSSYSWLAMGYPKRDTRWYDFYDPERLEGEFAEPDCLDINSALYEYYRIRLAWSRYGAVPRRPMRILDIGGGYGRLALPFIAAETPALHYVSVDFVPVSLLAAPQVVYSVSGARVSNAWSYDPRATFASVGAWDIERLPDNSFDMAVTVHSFQEMLPATRAFYLEQIRRLIVPKGVVYFLNQDPPLHGVYEYNGFEVADEGSHQRLGPVVTERVLVSDDRTGGSLLGR